MIEGLPETLGATLDDGVLELVLQRAGKRNALDTTLIRGLTTASRFADQSADVRVVLLRAEGPDFCAGADLAELLASADRPPAENEAAAAELGAVFAGFRGLPMPVLAMVQGRALAGGMGLVTSCDLVLAAEGAAFGYPEIQRGFVPAMVMTLLRRLVGERVAFDLAVAGRVIDAEEAARLGLITRVVPLSSLEDETRRLARTLAGRPRTAVALAKRLLYDLDGRSITEGLALGAKVNAHARTTPEFRAAIQAFLKA